MNYNNMIKKQSFIITLSIILMTITLIGSSYAIFFNVSKSKDDHIVQSGTLLIDYSQSTGQTNIGDENNEIESIPEEDVEGYNITVKNVGTLPMDYNILIYTGEDNELSHDYIRVKLDDNENQLMSELFKTSDTLDKTGNEAVYILGADTVAQKDADGDTNVHNIKVWLDYRKTGTDEEGLKIDVKVKVEGVVAGSEEKIKNGYVYWTDTEAHAIDSVPENTYSKIDELIEEGTDTTFIRTKYVNNSIDKHGSCMYYNGKLFCLDYGYWSSLVGSTEQSAENGNTVKESLQSEMEFVLDDFATSCESTNSSAYCTFDTATCYAGSDGDVYCGVETSKHIVDVDGTAYFDD